MINITDTIDVKLERIIYDKILDKILDFLFYMYTHIYKKRVTYISIYIKKKETYAYTYTRGAADRELV